MPWLRLFSTVWHSTKCMSSILFPFCCKFNSLPISAEGWWDRDHLPCVFTSLLRRWTVLPSTNDSFCKRNLSLYHTCLASTPACLLLLLRENGSSGRCRDQQQGDTEKLISRIPSSATAQGQPKESATTYRVSSSLKLTQGSFLLLENPAVRVSDLLVIFPQAHNSLFLEV